MVFYNVMLNDKKIFTTHLKEEVKNYLSDSGFEEDVYGIIMTGASYVSRDGKTVEIITKDRHFRVVPGVLVDNKIFERKEDAFYYLKTNHKYNSYSEYFDEISRFDFSNTKYLTHIDIVKDDFDMSDVRFFIKKCKHYYIRCGIGELIIETKSRKSRIIKVYMSDKSEEITVYLRNGGKDILHSGKEWYVLVRWLRDNVLVNTIDINFNYIGG